MLRYLKHFLGLGRSFFHFVCGGFLRSIFLFEPWLRSIFLPQTWPMAARATGPLPGPRRSSSTVRQWSWNIALPAKSSDRHVPPTAASVTTVWVRYTLLWSNVPDMKSERFVQQQESESAPTYQHCIFSHFFLYSIVVFKGFHTHFSSINQFNIKLITRQ